MNVKKTKKFKENRPENYHVPDNWVLDTAIGFAGAVGVAAFDDMAHVNERVGSLFLVNGLIN